VSKSSRVCFARALVEGFGEKRSWVSEVVAWLSWAKRVRRRDVALDWLVDVYHSCMDSLDYGVMCMLPVIDKEVDSLACIVLTS
jgi:hypothetical protein